jgi:hypothetical protein
MYFIDYSTLEEKIFNNVRKYFEKLTPIASDDYNNAFSDVIAQYGSGGEDYLIAESLFSDLIEVQTELAFEKMPVEEQKEIREFYEKHFLDNSFYDEEQEEFNYSNEDLALSLSDRFKVWVYDNYSIDDLSDTEEEDDDDEDEEDDEFEEEIEN